MSNRFKIVSILLLQLNFSGFLYATAQEDFLQANNLYAQRDYANAQKLYESIDNKGAAVWYNLGNCRYHLEHYPEALACWNRSLENGGSAWYDEVIHNCNHVQELLAIQPNGSRFDRFIYGIMNYSLLWWQLSVIMVLILLCITPFWFKGKKMIGAMGALASLMFLMMGCLGIKHRHLSRNYGFLLEETYLFAGTDERFSKHAILKKGDEVSIYDEQGQWAKVATSEGVGWILADTIIRI